MPNPATETQNIPQRCLAKKFPTFNHYWNQALKKSLGGVNISVKKDDEGKNLAVGIEAGGWGATAVFLGRNFYDQFKYRERLGEERDFVEGFTADLSFIIFEIRKDEHLWGKVYRELEKLITVNETETRSVTGKSGKNEHADKNKYQLMSKELMEKENKSGNSSGWEQGGVTITRKGINIVPLGKIISACSVLKIDFPKYYRRLSRWFDQYCSPNELKLVIDSVGRRRWVTEEEYEEIVEEETGTGRTVVPEDNEWDESLPYLERLKIYHAKNEKEYSKLPESSNRKPRVALRVKHGANCVKAYEKEVNLMSSQEFLDRINGKVEGYKKVIGYENIIKLIADYLASWGFYEEYGGNKPAQLMIGLLGEPGLGKTYISQAIGKALGVGYHRVSLNGKQSASIVYGTSIENPGAEIGEIVKAISNNQNQSCVVFFDEIEKAGKEAKDSIGDPTDRTGNETFKDSFYDFPTPCNNLIYICALNYEEELPDFIKDRFKMIEVTPPSYQQRLAILRTNLESEFRPLNEAFQKIYGKVWQEIYNLFNQEALLKKALTKTLSIRGAKDNILLSLLPTLRVDFLIPKKGLPNDMINYNWNFDPKEDLDNGDKRRNRPPCPYASDKSQNHRTGCKCFVNNLDKVLGWKENMGDN